MSYICPAQRAKDWRKSSVLACASHLLVPQRYELLRSGATQQTAGQDEIVSRPCRFLVGLG